MTINIKTFILGLNLKSCNLQTCFSISYQHININFSIRTGWFADAFSLIIAFNQFILISTHVPLIIGFPFVSPRQIEPACAAPHCLFFLPCPSWSFDEKKILYAFIAITSSMFSAAKRQIKYRVFAFYFSFKIFFMHNAQKGH